MKSRVAWLAAAGLLLLGSSCLAQEPTSADRLKDFESAAQSLDRATDNSRVARTRVDATGAIWTYEPRWGWSTNWRQYYRFDEPYVPGVGWPKRIPVFTLHYEHPTPIYWPVYGGYYGYPYRYYYGPAYPAWPAYGYGYYAPPVVNVIVNNNF